MNAPTLSETRWWRWPTILSLDAPAVTVLWQWLAARTTGVPQYWYHYVIVGGSIWLAYVADRWFESRRLPAAQLLTPRHLFYRRHQCAMPVFWLIVLIALVAVSVLCLTSRELFAGVLLLVPTSAYLLSHQLIHRHHPWRAPKELCIALLLAAGAGLFLAAAPAVRWEALGEILAWFIALAFANCALLGIWEQAVDRAHDQDSLARWYPRVHRLLHLLPWLLLALALGSWLAGDAEMRPVRACAALSAACLGGVDRLERRTGWPLARVLADATLVTPALWLIISLFSP